MNKFYLIILFLYSAIATGKSNCLDFHVIHSKPLGYLDSTGDIVGAQVDIINTLSKYSGLCINMTFMPYPRIWQSLKEGKHDGGIIFRSKPRAYLVEYVAKIRAVKVAVVARKPILLNSYDDLTGISIAIRRGIHLSEKFDNDKSLIVTEVNQYEQVIKMLMHKRVDAIAGSALILHYLLKTADGVDSVDFNKKLNLGEKEQWLQLSKNSKHIDKIPLLQKAIEDMKNDGRLDEITAKYYGPNWKSINQ